MSETTAEQLAEIDRDMVEIETLVADLARQALQADYPQQVETTTDTLAEIEGQAEPEPQPVQVREGRWRTRGGDVRNVTPTPEDDDRAAKYPWYDEVYDQTWMSDGRWDSGEEHQRDLVQYLGPIEPEPEKIITPDDVAGEALAGVWNQRQAERTIEDLQHRLDVVAFELGQQVQESKQLQQQLEAVKAELVQERLERNQWQNQAQRTETQLIEKISKCRNLQIELDALHQAPQAETAAAVPTSKDDRFEEGWDAGTAQAVETIAEWTEPFRTCGSERLAWMVMQNLPHIMRTLTGLADND